MAALLRRFTVYGDFWLRYLFFGARVCPWFLEPVIVWGFSVMFFFFCREQRHAVAANLRVIQPGLTDWQYARGTFGVIHHFAWSLADFAHVRLGEDVIDWEVDEAAGFGPVFSSASGVLVMTAHMGNYDVAAPLLAARMKRRIHTVRAPERHEGSQEFMREKRDAAGGDAFVVHYNEPGSMLAVELVKLLQGGEVVAIQGDRILFDVSPQELPFREGITWRLPRGPLMLALVARAPIVPVFVIRLGWRRYRIECGEPFHWPDDARDNEAALEAASQWWSERLRDAVERHWYQWFVFERAFQSASLMADDET